jgi:polyphosphate kinase 2 (PPK2 family)
VTEIAKKTGDTHLSRKQTRRIIDRYRVTSGKDFRLKDHDPADTAGHLLPKSQADAMLLHGVQRLAELQEKLYAQNAWAMLCALQAMDAAGKDSTINNVTVD